MSRSRFVNRIILFLFVSLTAAGVSAGPREEKSEANEVLNRFSGQWETETRIRNLSEATQQFETRGRAICQSTLEGRYFEFRTQTIPPGDSDLQIMTYDADAGVYRQWVFSSDGYTHEAQGWWNPTSSTLLWKGKTASGSFMIEDHWVSPDQLKWHLKRTDAKGQILQRIEGTLNRVETR